MNRRGLAAILALVSTFSAMSMSRLASAQQATPAAGGVQAFDVRLTLAPPVSGTGAAASAKCPDDLRQRLEQMRFQFRLMPSGAATMLAVAPTDLTLPTLARGDSATLHADGERLKFDKLSISTTSTSVMLSGGSIRLPSSAAGGPPGSLSLENVHVYAYISAGDVVTYCDTDATGAGTPDTMPPQVFLPSPCSDSATTDCALLTSGALTVAFSKPVATESLTGLVSASDGNGVPIHAVASSTPDSAGYSARIRGAWPLGGTVTLHVAPGVQDLVGNASSAAADKTFIVVADPGDLDAAGNSGFETGDLSGYSVLGYQSYRQFGPASLWDSDAFGVTASPLPAVVRGFQDVQPTEGEWMLQTGDLTNCNGKTTSLTARFRVPDGAANLVLDDNAVTSGRSGSGLLLQAAIGHGDMIATVQQMWPDNGASLASSDGSMQTGWQQVRLGVSQLAGQEVVLTLAANPQTLVGPPPICTPGVLLLDNLRFE